MPDAAHNLRRRLVAGGLKEDSESLSRRDSAGEGPFRSHRPASRSVATRDAPSSPPAFGARRLRPQGGDILDDDISSRRSRESVMASTTACPSSQSQIAAGLTPSKWTQRSKPPSLGASSAQGRACGKDRTRGTSVAGAL